MKTERELYEMLKKMFGKTDEVFPAIVKAVDKDENTCTIEFDELELGDVRLKATVNNKKGLKVYPAIDSVVLVQKLGDKEEYFITMYSEVEELVIETGLSSFKMNDEGFELSKESDTLKDVLSLIIEAMQKTIVLQGTSPDMAKLVQALGKVNNIFR